MAVALRDGPARGLAEIARIADRRRLARYPFYFAALGDLELRLVRRSRALGRFREALALARSPAERRFLERRLRECAAG